MTNAERAQIYTEMFEINAKICRDDALLWLRHRFERAMNEAEERGRASAVPTEFKYGAIAPASYPVASSEDD